MENKLVKGIANIGADLFTNIASSTSASACYFSFYQPEEPKCLSEEE